MPKGNKKPNEKKEELEKFAKELQGSDSDEDAVVIEQPTVEPKLPQNDSSSSNKIVLSQAEKDLLRTELDKTEEEISTLKQVLSARQKHAAELKRKLGLTPFSELSQDINRSLKTVTDTDAYQKTAEVAAATSDTVKEKWNDMRNSSLFKSFESKLGSALNNAKMAATTSIDHLAGAARGPSQTGTPVAEEAKPIS